MTGYVVEVPMLDGSFTCVQFRLQHVIPEQSFYQLACSIIAKLEPDDIIDRQTLLDSGIDIDGEFRVFAWDGPIAELN